MKVPLHSKILALHGYTQNAFTFRLKTGVLRRSLEALGYEIVYISGPIKLEKPDPSSENREWTKEDTQSTQESSECAWWVSDDRREEYIGLDQSLRLWTDTLEKEGPFAAVLGFSQGATAALALTTMLLNPNLREKYLPKSSHAPFKWTALFSGFKFKFNRYSDLRNARVTSPVLHVIGNLDTVTGRDRTDTVADVVAPDCLRLVVHPGGHYVPQQKVWVQEIMSFVSDTTPVQRVGDAKNGVTQSVI